jgi:hypothetical protein
LRAHSIATAYFQFLDSRAVLFTAETTGPGRPLKALEEFQIAPFESGYEGSPFNDFIGRLDDWQWPEP